MLEIRFSTKQCQEHVIAEFLLRARCQGMEQHEGLHQWMNDNYIEILHCLSSRTYFSLNPFYFIFLCYLQKLTAVGDIYHVKNVISSWSTGGSNSSIQYSMSTLWSHRMSRMKNVPVFIHRQQHVDHKERFFFLSVSKNIFPSVTLNLNLTGTLAESYFALALTLKYSMNFKLNEMHWEVGGFFFFWFFHAFLLFIMWKR